MVALGSSDRPLRVVSRHAGRKQRHLRVTNTKGPTRAHSIILAFRRSRSGDAPLYPPIEISGAKRVSAGEIEELPLRNWQATLAGDLTKARGEVSMICP